MKTIHIKPINEIFSSKKSEKKEDFKEDSKENKPLVLIDYREKNSLVPTHLKKIGIPIELKELKVADYIVSDIAIERKTISDFISSMTNQRLLNQIKDLQQYNKKLLIIEGIAEKELYSETLFNKKGGMHPNSIRGFLLSILLKHNIPVIYTKDSQDTARFISVIYNKKQTSSRLNPKKVSLNKKEQIQFILESFPGIGPKNAKKLLNEFKTLKNTLNAPEKNLRECIGKKADSIINLREIPY
ncbi:MAG: ERCC4 domain-containing protein [Nanoarchaeota archaeon]